MINSIEIPMFLEEAIPELSNDLAALKLNNPYQAMSALVSFTGNHIKNHDYKTTKRCFKIADKLYNKGNATVKSAVQNVYVYSFTRLFQTFPKEKQQLLAILPISLYTIYLSQVGHNGC